MKKIDWSYVPLVTLFGLSLAVAPVFHAQDQGSITRITTVPEGATYLVDGQPFNHSTSVLWPTGSKHTLSVPALSQSNAIRTLSTFINWLVIRGWHLRWQHPLAVTATPS